MQLKTILLNVYCHNIKNVWYHYPVGVYFSILLSNAQDVIKKTLIIAFAVMVYKNIIKLYTIFYHRVTKYDDPNTHKYNEPLYHK